MKSRIQHLRVKIASLAAEAQIIRRFEQRCSDPIDRSSFTEHRRGVVRSAARHALLAFAFLRGIDYARLESKTREAPDLAEVKKLVDRFGAQWDTRLDWKEAQQDKQDQGIRFEAWRADAEQHLGLARFAPALVAMGILAFWSVVPL